MSTANFDLTKLFLVPPGAGIHTVTTGSQWKNQLWENYYQTSEAEKVKNLWETKAKNIWQAKTPLIVGCPSDTGGAILRGASWGPLFARLAMQEVIAKFSEFDLGDIKVNPHLLSDSLLNTESLKKIRKEMYQQEIELPVSALSQIEYLSKNIWSENPARKVLFLGGDHSCSYPMVKSWCQSRKNKKFAILHFDAHTDLLKSRLGIDYCFGTWAYQALNFLPKPEHLLQVGIRTSGKDKKHWEDTLGVKQIWSDEIIMNSIDETTTQICNHFEKLAVDEIYISLDVDVLDPRYFSCTGTAESQGLSPHHITSIVAAVQKKFKVQVIDLMEFAPFIRQPQVSFSQLEPDTSMLTLKSLAPILWQALN